MAKVTTEAGRERIGGFVLEKAAAQRRKTTIPEEDHQDHVRVVATRVEHPTVGRAVEAKAAVVGIADEAAVQRRLLRPRQMLQMVQSKARRKVVPKDGNTTSSWRRLQWAGPERRGQMGKTKVVQTTDLISASIGKRFAVNGAKSASETGHALPPRGHQGTTQENVGGVEDIPAPRDRIRRAAEAVVAVVSAEVLQVHRAGPFIGKGGPCAKSNRNSAKCSSEVIRSHRRRRKPPKH